MLPPHSASLFFIIIERQRILQKVEPLKAIKRFYHKHRTDLENEAYIYSISSPVCGLEIVKNTLMMSYSFISKVDQVSPKAIHMTNQITFPLQSTDLEHKTVAHHMVHTK